MRGLYLVGLGDCAGAGWGTGGVVPAGSSSRRVGLGMGLGSLRPPGPTAWLRRDPCCKLSSIHKIRTSGNWGSFLCISFLSLALETNIWVVSWEEKFKEEFCGSFPLLMETSLQPFYIPHPKAVWFRVLMRRFQWCHTDVWIYVSVLLFTRRAHRANRLFFSHQPWSQRYHYSFVFVILLAVHISRRFFLLKEKASGTDSESSHTSRLNLLVHNPQMFLIS